MWVHNVTLVNLDCWINWSIKACDLVSVAFDLEYNHLVRYTVAAVGFDGERKANEWYDSKAV